MLKATIAVVVFLTVNSPPGYCSDLLDKHPDLKTRMAALLRWANFWKHPAQFKSYTPGKAVSVTGYYSGTRVEIFLPEIDLRMSFSIGAKGELVTISNGLLGGEPVAQAPRTRLRLQPHVRVKSVSPERTVIEDYWPPEIDVLRHYKVEHFSFRLPELTVPDSLQFKIVPKELESLKVAVGQAMVTWLCPEGQPIPQAVIPYFDVMDPYIYVAVDGAGRQRGFFIFVWRDGIRQADSKEWWPDPWKNSDVISLVQRHALATVKTDCPRLRPE
ncbi:MAG: hypothetical protein AB1898_32400 [Acidobacteriota bacterium]